MIDRSLSTEGLSLYKELGVEKDANASQIKRAYHKKALRCHPDKAGADNQEAADLFRKINRANNILQDERKRKIYDKMGSQGIAMVDTMGLDGVEAISKMDKWYYKVGALFCCLITGFCFGCCCCCCCLCCCCGKCKPEVDGDDDEQELHTGAGSDSDDKETSGNNHATSGTHDDPTAVDAAPPPYTAQPTSMDNSAQNATPNVVIAMPPPEAKDT